MGKSKRVYITLNPDKEKDFLILEYLNSTYNEGETIKSILYQVATNRCNEMNLKNIIQSDIDIEKELKGDNILKEEQFFEVNKGFENNIEVDDDIKNLFR